MERKIKVAFDSVHAEASLKEETKNRIAEKTRGVEKRPAGNFRRARWLWQPVLWCCCSVRRGILPTQRRSLQSV